ncbi:uncharacterized protein BX664DRAFT_260735 [Halteromyces radiatus]|uniref:uncharacterized protein n=1 Tax=Halteromyces radiatus TaxID=101107 RepID=UPI0022203B1B|nr:uncharacterized protein BX664DRAFT_260735 [Halteromyces radiatus]KAI8092703.1 hypothetical protein BX664DRAFT_260735 [Halteromyces radiatus]
MEVGIGKYGGLQPSFARVAESSEDERGFYGTMMNGLGNCLGFLGSIPCCFCFPNPYKRVQQGSIGVITQFGRFQRLVDPGLVKVNPVTEKIRKLDIRINITEIPRQDIMTKDNVSISIESVLFWHIVDPYEAHFGVSDVQFALVERARTSLRDICGSHFLQDLIENRDAISAEIKEIIDPVAKQWGVKIEATLVKDITFSQQLQESLASAALAVRLGESRVIASKAEVEAAKLMRDAADIMNSQSAQQIRYLDTLVAMSRAGDGPKTVFMPLPASGAGGGGGVGGVPSVVKD